MGILETKEEAAASEAKKEERKKALDDTIDTLHEAERIVNKEMEAEEKERKRREDPLGATVDVDAHVETHRVLESTTHGSNPNENPLVDRPKNEVVPDEDDKEAFLVALSTGARYEREFSLFGGKVTGVFRARTIGESEAISAYARRKAIMNLDMGAEGYGDLMKLCLLVACVKRLGDVEYPEMSFLGNLLRTENENGMVEPGWVKQIDVWRGKPEAVLLAIMPEYFKFEAKYYMMTQKAADENFWKTGPSTGK